MQKSFLDLFSCKANLSEQQQHLFFSHPNASYQELTVYLSFRMFSFCGKGHILMQVPHANFFTFLNNICIFILLLISNSRKFENLSHIFWHIFDAFLMHFSFFNILLILQKSTKILRKIFWISKITSFRDLGRDTFLVFRKGPSTSSCPMRMRRTRNLVRRSVVY